MSAVHRTLLPERGATFAHGWQVNFNSTPIEDDWTSVAVVTEFAGGGEVLHTFTSSVVEGGVVTVGMTATETAAAVWDEGWFSVVVVDAGGTPRLRVAEGRVMMR